MKKLIINADDFGWDADTTNTTIALIERGWITSATIMTRCEASELAMDYARVAGSRVSFGLHFNIVDHHKAYLAAPNSLVDSDNRFRPSHRQRLAAMLGRLRRSDIAAELRAQLSELKRHRVRISHLDSHGHLHKFPAIAQAIGPVLTEFGVVKIRRPQNLYTRRSFRDVLDYYCALRFPHYVSTDYFWTPSHGESAWLSDLHHFLPEGTTEIGIHPGQAEAWRRSEIEAFFSSDPKALNSIGIELINYHQLTRQREGDLLKKPD